MSENDQLEVDIYPEEQMDGVFNPDSSISDSVPIGEYDLVSTPNDFNVLTIKNFLDTGAVKVPRYQRNFVWDRSRASRLIESLILGLPVPQVFLYEEARNSFQIIDGQQRLMSIYFFLVGRFPKKMAKPKLREYWGNQGAIPSNILADDTLFESFRLNLPSGSGSAKNPLHGLKYETLEDKQIQLGMRTLRNVIIKQINPDGRGAVYEIFNRLNTTGVNLTAQEIRLSLADSELMEKIVDANVSEKWRKLFGVPTPDPRLRDIEIILRAFAMADESHAYRPSMVKFLDSYADKTRSLSSVDVEFRIKSFNEFLDQIDGLSREPFLISGRFSVPIFEAIYTAFFQGRLEQKNASLTDEILGQLNNNQGFVDATSTHTTDTKYINSRINIAKSFLYPEADSVDGS